MIVGDKDKLDTKKRGLGRGLSALFEDDETASGFGTATTPAAKTENAGPRRTLGVDQLTPGTYQARQPIDDATVRELADSIAVHGVLQPIIVRPMPGNDNKFEIIAGERRWRAAQLARLHEVPVVVRNLTDVQAMEIGLIENLQREDINILEEAQAYGRLIQEFGHTQEKIADAIGKSRSHVANILRMLELPADVREMLQRNILSAGHARALLGAADPMALARAILDQKLNVRDTEKLATQNPKARGAARRPGGKAAHGAAPKEKDVNTIALEKELSDVLGMRVAVDMQDSKEGQPGTLKIEFKTLDQLDYVIRRLSQGAR